MVRCKHWGSGWCYAPVDVQTNSVSGECHNPQYCPHFRDHLKMTATDSDDTSRKWAIALTDLIDELGGDGPSLWKHGDEIPTPESIVKYLNEHILYLQQCAADDELLACAELIVKRYSGCTDSGLSLSYHISEWLKNTRRPKPSPKSRALKDIKDMKKSCSVDPAILTNIEQLLLTVPD